MPLRGFLFAGDPSRLQGLHPLFRAQRSGTASPQGLAQAADLLILAINEFRDGREVDAVVPPPGAAPGTAPGAAGAAGTAPDVAGNNTTQALPALWASGVPAVIRLRMARSLMPSSRAVSGTEYRTVPPAVPDGGGPGGRYWFRGFAHGPASSPAGEGSARARLCYRPVMENPPLHESSR